MSDVKSLVERANEAARRAPNAAFIRDLADAIEQQAARIAALESENRELSEFVIAVGGFWGNSKSKLVGELSLAEVINRGLKECRDAEATIGALESRVSQQARTIAEMCERAADSEADAERWRYAVRNWLDEHIATKLADEAISAKEDSSV